MEIELYSKMSDPLDAINRIGQFFAKSGMFGCDRVEQGQVLAMICMAEKKSPVAITRDYDIVEGKLRKKAMSALAEFRLDGGKHKWLKSGDEPTAKPEDRAAELELTDKEGNKIAYRYSMADAAAEGLIKPRSRWEKRPGNMLRARCMSNGLGMLCPEIFAGDDESDYGPSPAAEIKLDQKGARSDERETAIEVQATKVETVEPAKEEVKEAKSETVATAATAEPKPEVKADKPFQQGPAYSTPAGVKLSDDLCRQVETAIGEHAKACATWMLKEGWLKAGQDITDLTEARARRILKQRDSFIKAATAQ